MEKLEGRVAVVTGGGSGIGAATARLLAEQDMKVVLADVDEARLQSVVEALQQAGLAVSGVVTDVSEFASVRKLADTAFDRHGAVHVLHLNAGIAGGGSLFDDETSDWERVIGVNLEGVVWGIKAFVPRMLEGGDEGFVIATSSGAGAEGTSFRTASYAATKMAVLSLMECLHGQLQERDARLRAGVLFPPLTATNLSGGPETMKMVEQMLRSQGVPATLVQPESVARLVLDGIRRNRFFFRCGARESKEFFDGAITDEFLAWNDRMIRGRAEAVLGEDVPDAYLW
jgi:NAD(P)-dependent dehydrogenase (short-subunit alcohol dehydrogenase family)